MDPPLQKCIRRRIGLEQEKGLVQLVQGLYPYTTQRYKHATVVGTERAGGAGGGGGGHESN